MQSTIATILRPVSPAPSPEPRSALRAQGESAESLHSACLLLSAAALGCALQINFGQYHPLALPLLSVALACCIASVAAPAHRWLRLTDRKAALTAGTALALQFVLLLTRSPGATGTLAGTSNLLPFRAGIVAAFVFAAGAVFAPGRRGRACLFAMLFVHAALGIWILRAAPNPGVDVVMFQRDASNALLKGDNPYALTFPAPIADPPPFYGPGVVRDGRLQFGFPYPPLSLMMTLPGYLLGDFRYAQLFAMTVAGALVAFARPSRLATLAAALLLFTPRGFFVLEAGWTEPFAALLLTATVFVACRARWARAVPVAVGLLIAVKQYLVLCLLITPLLRTVAPRQRNGRLFTARALAVAAAITVPIALWDLPAFVHSVVLLQFRQPFREDALSYLAAVFQLTGWRAPAWIAFAVTLPAIVFCICKCSRTPAGFAGAVGLVCFVFFAFNKQAFCNYYYFVIGALCCAAGAAGGGDAGCPTDQDDASPTETCTHWRSSGRFIPFDPGLNCAKN